MSIVVVDVFLFVDSFAKNCREVAAFYPWWMKHEQIKLTLGALVDVNVHDVCGGCHRHFGDLALLLLSSSVVVIVVVACLT